MKSIEMMEMYSYRRGDQVPAGDAGQNSYTSYCSAEKYRECRATSRKLRPPTLLKERTASGPDAKTELSGF